MPTLSLCMYGGGEAERRGLHVRIFGFCVVVGKKRKKGKGRKEKKEREFGGAIQSVAAIWKVLTNSAL